MTENAATPPSNWLMALETRALFEFGAMAAASPLLRAVGRGDRHPVLVLPGFTAGDRSTGALRGIIRSNGYWAHGWRLGRNVGPTSRILDGLSERLEALHERHGMPVSIVGWSLGGIYARAMARERPEMIRQVITLGSPFRMVNGDRSSASDLWDSLRHRHVVDALDLQMPESERTPLQVPATAIYTRTDGIVRWWMCLEDSGPFKENIEVIGSHSGLGFNPAVVLAVLDRLAQPIGDWRPYHPGPWVRHLFPLPATWQPAGHAA